QDYAETAECPAVVRDRYEKGCGQSIERADLAADQRHLTAKAHRADIEVVHRRHDRRFKFGQPRVRIHIVERPEQLPFRMCVPRRSIAANAYTDCTRTAALPLGMPDGVKDRFLDAIERAVGATEMRQLHW